MEQYQEVTVLPPQPNPRQITAQQREEWRYNEIPDYCLHQIIDDSIVELTDLETL